VTPIPEVADRAIWLLAGATEHAKSDSDRVTYLVNLCTAHRKKHPVTGDVVDLDRAVEAGETAVELAARFDDGMVCGAANGALADAPRN
jgi:hypothetical protein